jgi:hypothetical protein
MQTYIVRSKKQAIATINHVAGQAARIELLNSDFFMEINADITDKARTKLINRIKQMPRSIWEKS